MESVIGRAPSSTPSRHKRARYGSCSCPSDSATATSSVMAFLPEAVDVGTERSAYLGARQPVVLRPVGAPGRTVAVVIEPTGHGRLRVWAQLEAEALVDV